MTLGIFVLCIVQAITEFLPVSSNAHLLIVERFIGQNGDIFLNVALHFGTLLTVVCYFHREVKDLFISFLKLFFNMPKKHKDKHNKNLLLSLILATIPAVIVGFLVKKADLDLGSNLKLLAFSSIFFGILLYVSDKYCRSSYNSSITKTKAFIIGLFQTLAFIPAVSRSGICITGARFLGIDRIEATRFSFVLSIPTVLGATTLSFYDGIKQNLHIDYGMLFCAITITFFVGLLVIHALMKFLKNNNFSLFALYRVLLGIFILWFFC